MLDRPPGPDLNSRPLERPAILPMQARGLTLERAGQRLIDGIDLDLTPNGITMVMGFNGAGKSLLLRLLHGMIEPTSGTVAWAGRPLDLSLRRRQAMVFQRPVLLRRSVRANIDFALSLKTGSGHWNHDTLLFHVGLLEKANQPARLLSGGEQQRLALARALAIEPDILFLDEPTASLDPASILLIEEIVQRAHDRGTKIVFVTHDIGQARRLADDIVFLHRGRVVERAPAVHFLTNPSSPAGQAYLGGRLFV